MTTPDGRFGYGLVVEGGGVPFIAVLGGLHKVRPPLEDLRHGTVALLGWTMDAWFYHGRWPVVGSLDLAGFDIPLPDYIVEVEGEPHVTNFKGEIMGPAGPQEQRLLDYRSSRSPIGFHNAFLALHGYREWDSADDKLTAHHSRTRISRGPAI